MERVWDILVQFAMTTGLSVLYAILLLLIGWKLIKVFIKLLSRSKGFNRIEPGAQTFLRSFVSIGLKIVLIITAVGILGVPLSSVVALLASAGLAIGLALQGALSNFAGGLMILIFKPFQVGDYIESQSLTGTVTAITVFYTVLLTQDNKKITIPNGTMTNSFIINYSAEKSRRVDLTFKVSYQSDLEQVKQILMDIADRHPSALKKPEPVARLLSHDDSALNFVLRVWCESAEYLTVLFDLTEEVKREFDKHHIGIPSPQMDVYVTRKE